MADYLSGLLGGFLDRKREIEEQNLYEGIRSREREASILQTLIQSPDPETRNLAIAGLLDSASPAKRKSGLKGWIGQIEQSPWLERIRGLSPTVQQPTAMPDAPTQSGYLPTPPPAAGSAAQPTTSPTVRGADGAPLSPVQPMPNVGVASGTEVARFRGGVEAQAPLVEPPPQVGLGLDARGVGAPPPNTLGITQPRQVMPTPADLARQQMRAKALGEIEGGAAGFEALGGNPAEYRAGMLAQMQRGLGGSTTPYQAVPGEYYDASQDRWIATYATFDKRTGRWMDAQNAPIVGPFRQTPRTAQHTMGIAFERAARELGFANGNAVPPGMEAEAVNARAIEILQQESYARGQGTGQARYEAPITPAVAAQTNLPVGTRGSDVAGQRIPSQAIATARRSLQDAVKQIREGILPKLDVLPSKTELFGETAPGLRIAERRISRRADIGALESALSAIKANLVRARGEVGALSESDIARVDQSLVVLNTGLMNFFGADNQESAHARLDETLRNLDQVLNNMPAAPTVGVGAAPPAAGATTRPVTKTFKDANGVWQITLP